MNELLRWLEFEIADVKSRALKETEQLRIINWRTRQIALMDCQIKLMDIMEKAKSQ